MQRLVALFVVAGLTIPLAGCFVSTRKPHGHSSARQTSCHPSQYWDGNQCRHKGQGKGARKHDGR